MTFHSGKYGAVTINGIEIPIKNWTFRATGPMARFVNSLLNGFKGAEPAAGKEGNFTFQVSRDFDSNSFGPPTSLIIHQQMTNVKLYEHGTSGPYYNIPSSYISDTNQSVAIMGTDEIGYGVSAVVDGTFAYPGGYTPV